MKKLLILVCALLVSACAPNYSNGSWAGTITKISNKGIIWKTWEGQILLGGMKKDAEGNQTVNAVNFNVEDPVLVEKIMKAAESGERIKLIYRQWLLSPPTIDASHVIIDVKNL